MPLHPHQFPVLPLALMGNGKAARYLDEHLGEGTAYFMAQSQIKTDAYTITGTIAKPRMILDVMKKQSPNERITLFFNVAKADLNLNAHQARYPFICFDETPLCLQLINVMNDV